MKGSIKKGDIISPKSDWCFKELFDIPEVREDFLSEVLEIPKNEIANSVVVNSFLWKWRQKEKQGILDVRVRLRDGTKINIEIQLRKALDWKKRSLYYLGKMYTEDLRVGRRQYENIKRCIQIQILDFNLIENEYVHNVFLFQNEERIKYAEEMQIHVIELTKKEGKDGIMEWVQLMNLEKKEDAIMMLGMTKREGIQLAIEQLLAMSGSKKRRAIYEMHLKFARDRHAEIAYGREEGRTEGRIEGRTEGIVALIEELQQDGKTREEVSERIKARFTLSEEMTEEYMQKYWK